MQRSRLTGASAIALDVARGARCRVPRPGANKPEINDLLVMHYTLRDEVEVPHLPCPRRTRGTVRAAVAGPGRRLPGHRLGRNSKARPTRTPRSLRDGQDQM
jgi:hypothetical protein